MRTRLCPSKRNPGQDGKRDYVDSLLLSQGLSRDEHEDEMILTVLFGSYDNSLVSCCIVSGGFCSNKLQIGSVARIKAGVLALNVADISTGRSFEGLSLK